MRTALVVVTLVLAVVPSSAQSPAGGSRQGNAPMVTFGSRTGAIADRARRLSRAEYCVGFGNAEGQFLQLVREALKVGTQSDFDAMLRDRSPMVRLLGILCIARSNDSASFERRAGFLTVDAAPLVLTNGCVVDQRTTIGAVVKQIREGTFDLGPNLDPESRGPLADARD